MAVDYEDRISVATPEGVTLEVTLAGVGSRFLAEMIDQALQFVLIVALWLAGAWLADSLGSDDSAALVGALLLLSVFLVQFGYPVLFETLASGRPPGKRWTGLRVVKVSGGPVDFTASAVRNLLRLVDMLPAAYLVGIVAVLASKRNQRLGDMAAGTLVVREKEGGRRKATPAWARPLPVLEPSPEAAMWDVTAVTTEELATVRRFLDRRGTLTSEARSRLAVELALRLRPKVVGSSDDLHPEEFLVELVAVKSARG